jgi:hypothetical protein
MNSPSDYEKLQIGSLLGKQNHRVHSELGLFLMAATDAAQLVFNTAVRPAMHASGLATQQMEALFTSSTALVDVLAWLGRAEVIVVELSNFNADVAYVLGLAHAMGRCPIMIAREPMELPFNLEALRCIRYTTDLQGIYELREELTRALRVFLAAARSNPKSE